MTERILFRNDACLVINKRPGESSEHIDLEGERSLRAIHRLDIPVSGCLLLARNAPAAAFLSGAFARQGVQKRYWAVIEEPQDKEILCEEGELRHWIYEDKEANRSIAASCKAEKKHPKKQNKPKEAALRYRIAGRGDRYLFLEIDLITGRHHQIRAQLAALGLHIKGDLKYGAKRSEKQGGIRLHACSLTFPNPLSPGEDIRVNAPPPEMDSLWIAFMEQLFRGEQFPQFPLC